MNRTTTPPWDRDDAWRDGSDELLSDLERGVLTTLLEVFGQFTDAQEAAIREAVRASASYGWTAAKMPESMRVRRRVSAADESRRQGKDKRHQEIRFAFAKAGRGGRDVDIATLAKDCGVSVATVYRALGSRR